ncbi:MAG: aspartate aminotransferase family protein [Chloroflexi bacterium]|nr:aspartate aminotransferase family protein [Chloroflexota bacterium]
MPITAAEHAALVEKDKLQLHPLQHPKAHADPLIVERSEGVYLYTTDGRKILDAMAGLWNVNIGYGRKECAEAAYKQMLNMAYTSNYVGMSNRPSIELAARLAGYAHPTLNHTFFTSGGSEANDSAFKTARYYWKRMGKKDKYKVIARKSAYHGITLAATFATGVSRYHEMFGPAIPGFIHVPAPYPYRYEGDMKPGETVGQAAARAVEEAILREGPDTVAAYIAEPVMGVGGVIIPPDDYFPLVRQICDKYDVLLMVDEVINGFGRTGKRFGINHWNLRPDILSFAKGVTSGYLPLGGIQVSDAIMDAINSAPESESWMHGHTYSGHPASCAVGLVNLDIYERENLVEHSRLMGEKLQAGLKSLMVDFPQIGEARGIGLLCGIEFVKDRKTKEQDPATAAKVANAAQARGIRARSVPNATVAFSPPLTINEDEIDQIIKTFAAVLDSI